MMSDNDQVMRLYDSLSPDQKRVLGEKLSRYETQKLFLCLTHSAFNSFEWTNKAFKNQCIKSK